MRTRSRITLATVAAFAALATVAAASGDDPTRVLVDTEMDGNGLNGQGIVPGVPGTPLPVNAAGGDILHVDAYSEAAFLRLELGTSAMLQPDSQGDLAIETTIDDCNLRINLIGDPTGENDWVTELVTSGGCGDATNTDGIQWVDSSATFEHHFVLTFADLPDDVAAYITRGNTLTGMTAYSYVAGMIVMIDEAHDPDATYKI